MRNCKLILHIIPWIMEVFKGKIGKNRNFTEILTGELEEMYNDNQDRVRKDGWPPAAFSEDYVHFDQQKEEHV